MSADAAPQRQTAKPQANDAVRGRVPEITAPPTKPAKPQFSDVSVDASARSADSCDRPMVEAPGTGPRPFSDGLGSGRLFRPCISARAPSVLFALTHPTSDADVFGVPRSPWLLIVLAVTTSACHTIASDDARREVCREQEREVLVAEELHQDSPSTPFTVDAGADVWVGLIADSDYSPSALFSQVTGLYVIDEGDVVAYTRDDLDFVVTDDPFIDFDREAEFVPFEFAPDDYQLWSIKTPEIAVVVCPPAND